MRFPFFHLPIFLLLFSCTGRKESNSTDAVYAHYSITGDEGAEFVTCLLKFYKGDSRGASLYLESPAAVLFDGIAVPGDSAGLSGAYYEVQKPLAEFSGAHTIVFKSAEGREYKETFTFQPITITSELTETVPRDAIVLQLGGTATADLIRVLLTDTSFTTRDINEIDTVENGQLTITRGALRNVASGPVTLHLFKEEERRLKDAPAGGGRLSITYGLRREFELTDD